MTETIDGINMIRFSRSTNQNVLLSLGRGVVFYYVLSDSYIAVMLRAVPMLRSVYRSNPGSVVSEQWSHWWRPEPRCSAVPRYSFRSKCKVSDGHINPIGSIQDLVAAKYWKFVGPTWGPGDQKNIYFQLHLCHVKGCFQSLEKLSPKTEIA